MKTYNDLILLLTDYTILLFDHIEAKNMAACLNLADQFAEHNKLVSDGDSEDEYEPYFGWCNVEGCENEGANGGGCWRETGYWTVCLKHSQEYREGKPQPPMKQWAIDREKGRGPDGMLVNESKPRTQT